MDFDCGAGRLLIPHAKNSGHVDGDDISESMLIEARKNCDSFSVNNVNFLKSGDELSELTGEYGLTVYYQHQKQVKYWA